MREKKRRYFEKEGREMFDGNNVIQGIEDLSSNFKYSPGQNYEKAKRESEKATIIIATTRFFTSMKSHQELSTLSTPKHVLSRSKTFVQQMWVIPSLFFLIFVFSLQLTVNKCSVIKFPDDRTRTTDL